MDCSRTAPRLCFAAISMGVEGVQAVAGKYDCLVGLGPQPRFARPLERAHLITLGLRRGFDNLTRHQLAFRAH